MGSPSLNEKKIFIGNLPFSITSEELKMLFCPVSEVSITNYIIDALYKLSEVTCMQNPFYKYACGSGDELVS